MYTLNKTTTQSMYPKYGLFSIENKNVSMHGNIYNQFYIYCTKKKKKKKKKKKLMKVFKFTNSLFNLGNPRYGSLLKTNIFSNSISKVFFGKLMQWKFHFERPLNFYFLHFLLL